MTGAYWRHHSDYVAGPGLKGITSVWELYDRGSNQLLMRVYSLDLKDLVDAALSSGIDARRLTGLLKEKSWKIPA